MREESKDKMVLPQVRQIGIVVKDVENAIEYFSSNFGLGPFRIFEQSRDAIIHGKPQTYKTRVAIAPMGTIQLELTQVLEGKPIQAEFLEAKGEGVHHLAFWVDNLSEEVAKWEKKGFGVLQYAEVPERGVSFAFLDTGRVAGVVFELIYLPEYIKRRELQLLNFSNEE